MKQFFLLLLACCFCNVLFAQFQIGDAMVPTGGKAGALKSDDLETFKKTTTIFVLQVKDKERMADFQKSIGEVWTITPFRVVMPDSAHFFRGKKYSMFGFGGFTVEHRSTTGHGISYSNTHISYDLTIPDYNKHGEADGRTILARFILSPDIASVMDLSRQGSTFEGRSTREERGSSNATSLYKTATYTNWGPGQIRGYLKAINDHLAEGKRRGIFDEIIEKDRLKVLAHDTLYMPDYLKDKFNPFSGAEKSDEGDEAEEDASKAYPYPHRYVATEELDRMIVYATKPVYHLIYVRSSTNKYVSVVEGKSGSIIYSLFHNLSYNFKMKDLKKLTGYLD